MNTNERKKAIRWLISKKLKEVVELERLLRKTYWHDCLPELECWLYTASGTKAHIITKDEFNPCGVRGALFGGIYKMEGDVYSVSVPAKKDVCQNCLDFYQREDTNDE